MHQASAYLETVNGPKYLAQLCKHFAHKIEVFHSEGHGVCRFPFGTGILDADESGLRMVAEAAGADELKRTQEVIESHLMRFAFREPQQALQWHGADQAAPA
ncbi:MAG: DUF2218 domain-containing protein [Rhizobiales bacterium]|nr:DUF2218 domain-containing protein [Hyphomicrobiales bacterium]